MVMVELKGWGNSLRGILPAKKLKALGLHKGDTIEIEIAQKKRADGFGICKGAKVFAREKESHGEFLK